MVSHSQFLLNFYSELIVTVSGLFGSRLEAIIFCPDRLAWLSVSLDPSDSEPQGPWRDPEDPPLVLESSGDTWESLKTSWALFAKDSRTTMRPLALSISYPSDFLLGHIRRKHGVHTDCHQLCVFCPDTHSSRSHFPVCKTDVPWFLWSACCHTVLSCLCFSVFLFVSFSLGMVRVTELSVYLWL